MVLQKTTLVVEVVVVLSSVILVLMEWVKEQIEDQVVTENPVGQLIVQVQMVILESYSFAMSFRLKRLL
jgi:hypothetical protein